MMGQEHSTTSRSLLSRLGKALVWLIRFLLRLLIVLAVCAAVGASLYFGGTFVYRQYLEPVPVHTIRLDILEGRQNRIVEQLTQQQGALQFRVDEVELRSDARKLALDSLWEQQIAMETSQAGTMGRLDEVYVELEQLQTALGEGQLTRDTIQMALEALQATQDAGQVDLEALRVDLETLQVGLTSIESALETVQGDLAAIQTGVADLSGQVDEYSLDVAALREELSGEKSPTALLHELQLVKAMELLTRARLVLVQNNLGLAQFDIQAGRRLLVDPDELEGAWQLLVAGLPKESPVAPAPEPIPTTTPTIEPTPTPTVRPTLTPTAQS
jgi:hypothetical protein